MLENFLVFLIVIVGFVPMVIEFKCKRFDVFNIKNAFIVYYVIQLGFSGLISIKSKYPSEIGLSPVYYYNYYILALFASLVGLLSFQLGYYFTSNKRFKIPDSWKANFKGINSIYILLGYLSIGFIAFFLLILKGGGLSQFLNNREEFRAGGLIGQGYLIYPATHLLTQGVVVYAFYIFGKQNIKRRHIFSLFFFLFLSIVPSFLMGFRGLIVLPILEFLVIWNYRYKQIPVLKMIPIGFVLVVGFVVYGIIREIPPEIKISPKVALDIVDKNPELAYAFLSRSKGVEVVASEVKKLQQTGEYELGYNSILESLTIFIPGAIWPNKPEPSSVKFTTYFFGDDLSFSRGQKQESWGGISPTILGEAYWHFGWFGITLGLGLFGFLLRKIYITFINNRNHTTVMMLYAEVYPIFVMMAEAVQGYANSLVLYGISFVFTVILLKINFNK